MTDPRIEEIVTRCQRIEGIHWDNDTVARAEMVAREALTEAGPGVCPKCHGSGHTTVVETFHGERNQYHRVICSVCKGTGKAASPSPAPTQDGDGTRSLEPLASAEYRKAVDDLYGTKRPPAPTQASPPKYEPVAWRRMNRERTQSTGVTDLQFYADQWQNVEGSIVEPLYPAAAIQALTGRVRELEAAANEYNAAAGAEHRRAEAAEGRVRELEQKRDELRESLVDARDKWDQLLDRAAIEKARAEAAEAAVASERERADKLQHHIDVDSAVFESLTGRRPVRTLSKKEKGND